MPARLAPPLQAIDCMSIPDAPPPQGGPGGRAMTRAQMMVQRRDTALAETVASAEKFYREYAGE